MSALIQKRGVPVFIKDREVDFAYTNIQRVDRGQRPLDASIWLDKPKPLEVDDYGILITDRDKTDEEYTGIGCQADLDALHESSVDQDIIDAVFEDENP